LKRINVSFDLTGSFSELTDQVRALAEQHGLECSGSGTGFGRRDIDVEGTTEQLEAFTEAVRALPALADLDPEVTEPDDIEEDSEEE